MPTVFKEVQDSSSDEEALHQDSSATNVGSQPDIVIEHGSTRLSLDLDGWEWFWLFLAVCFIGSLWIWFS